MSDQICETVLYSHIRGCEALSPGIEMLGRCVLNCLRYSICNGKYTKGLICLI